MSRMLELVRTSQLASHQMMSASKGALRVPATEMVEILVYIAEHNKVFRETARMTLAGWEEASAKQIAADPNTPREVLDYWLSPQNIRPALLPVLVENPSVTATKLGEVASIAKGDLLDIMIASTRFKNSRYLLHDLSTNHFLSGAQTARLQALINGDPAEPAQPEAPALDEAAKENPSAASPMSADQPAEAAPGMATATSQERDPEVEGALIEYLTQHADEIAAEGDKPFKAIGGVFDTLAAANEAAPPIALAAAAGAGASASAIASSPAAPAPVVSPATSPSSAKPSVHKAPVNPEDERRGSTLQKIAALDVKGRIQLAMKGSKEERSILVRDGTKIVALAVLDSPKISDGEVEKFASQKNVLEALLRAIPMKRRFAKNYVIMRNLVANPRTPLDVGLGLMKNLLVGDLKNLSGNKEVSETVRKMAMRMFRQKAETPK